MFNLLSLFKKEPKPFNSGYLPEKDGHKIFFHEFGNPSGEVIISFHGGPGSKSKAKHARSVDLKKYRLIMFDQRGCGLSEPVGEIKNNTPKDLVEDAKRLLDYLGIDKVISKGGSWGSTLAVLFAEAYPERVTKIICSAIFLARPKDLDWTMKESRIFYPDMMDIIEKDIPEGKDTREYYADILLKDDVSFEDMVKVKNTYGSYEHMVGELDPKFSNEIPDEESIKAFKIYLYYEVNKMFMEENQILNNANKIKHIPTLLVHNRLDMICPVEQAWLLHKTLPNSKLVIVPDYGHGSDLLDKTLKAEVRKFLN